ncbi:MAG: Mn2+/Fe2+ NRAMP family transporter, partial [Moritella sp.]
MQQQNQQDVIMQTTLTVPVNVWRQRLKALGPGIMMATAAVGG